MIDRKEPATFLQVICLAPFAAVWKSYVIVIMWGWFVVPMGIEHIGMGHAYGLVITCHMFCKTGSSGEATISKMIEWAVLFPLITLAFGYATHLWMTW